MQLFQLNPNESDNSNVTITLKTTTLFCQRGHVTKFHFKVLCQRKLKITQHVSCQQITLKFLSKIGGLKTEFPTTESTFVPKVYVYRYVYPKSCLLASKVLREEFISSCPCPMSLANCWAVGRLFLCCALQQKPQEMSGDITSSK